MDFGQARYERCPLVDFETEFCEASPQERSPCFLICFQGLDEIFIAWDIGLLAEVDCIEPIRVRGGTN